MDAVVSAREPQYRSDQNQNRSPDRQATLGSDELRRMNAYWRAANYLSVGQIYLYDNPLLKEPLKLSHVKPLVVGHWGTTPGQNFIYVHLNRVIKKYDLDMFYIAGPGHGGPAIVGNVYLEGTWSEIYPNVTQDEAGLKKLFKQFSFPGGISSHVAPTTPGSIHEGGELGYSLSHAFGAAFDNPDLIVACVIGDGEAETGPLATAWQSNKFLNPITDGAVLPILHLNGYKISNPTVLARIEHEELEHPPILHSRGLTPPARLAFAVFQPSFQGQRHQSQKGQHRSHGERAGRVVLLEQFLHAQRHGVGASGDVAGDNVNSAELTHVPGIAQDYAVQHTPADVRPSDAPEHCRPLAPRLTAAMSSSGPTASITGISSRTTNGSVTKVVTRISPGVAKMTLMP